MELITVAVVIVLILCLLLSYNFWQRMRKMEATCRRLQQNSCPL